MFRTTLTSLALATVASSAVATGSPVTAAQAAASTNQVWISGTPGATGLIFVILQGSCDPSTFSVFKSNHASFTNDLNDGDSYTAYSCNLLASNDFGLAAGTVVTVNKRDRSGSVYGVIPVLENTAIDFMDLNTCTNNLCTGTLKHTADAGISDLDPVVFNNKYNRPTELSSSPKYSGTHSFSFTQAIYGQAYGMAVSMPLYHALQAQQNTSDVPSMSTVIAGSFFGNNMIDWSVLGVTNSNYQINICRSANGSGVQAAANVYFGQIPNETFSGWLPSDKSQSTVGANTINTSYIATNPGSGNTYIYEAQNTSQLKNCFAAATSAGAYSMGVMQLGVDVSTDYAFVRMEVANPTRDSVKQGGYSFFFETSIQFNNALAAGAAKTFLNNLATKLSNPTYMGQLPGPLQQGIVALPTLPVCQNTNGLFGSFSAGSAQDTFCSRATRWGTATYVPLMQN